MLLTRLEISGFKSFAKKTVFDFASPVVSIVGPNGSGKSNVAESLRFVLGEQSMKSMRGKRGEDLIWNGSNAVPRANRGSVTLAFDNRTRFLNIDFDEVVIERVVNRDGTNDYRMNGSPVRLKDILEILASANIGQTGHHIISQGEADKILSASPRERREMLEDALGLKVYQYKLEESKRKLEKTEENMRQVEALRREIAPHLRFLKKQVEKVEKAKELRVGAVERFRAYFKREDDYVTGERNKINAGIEDVKKRLASVEREVSDAKALLQSSAEDKRADNIVTLSRELDAARFDKSESARKVARLDGQIEIIEKTAAKASVPATSITQIVKEGEETLSSLKSTTPEKIIEYALQIFSRLKALVESAEHSAGDLGTLKSEREQHITREREAASRERELSEKLERIRSELESARAKERDKERKLFELTGIERELKHALSSLLADSERLTLVEDEMKRELGEAATLFGRDILSYKELDVEPVLREVQEKEKRELEKTKIRLEEMGAAGGDDVMREYEEASQRETFLERELSDLTEAATSLHKLIEDLEKELGSKFDDGLESINTEFTKLFALMFDGGAASLVRVEESVKRPKVALLDGEEIEPDDEPEESGETVKGIDIHLSIPRKRVKSLVMLSGGERALTSIALIFAMSQVNPPPFLVLDETDAALDESNSRRYGDMVAELAKKSQLVLITHNRETMSRAGILYGVTMGGDGVSKVLSVKLEEAVKVAK